MKWFYISSNILIFVLYPCRWGGEIVMIKKIKIIEHEGRKRLMCIFISMKGGSEIAMANNK